MSQETINWFVTEQLPTVTHKFQNKGHLLRGMFQPPVRAEADTVKWKIAGRAEAKPLQRGARGHEMNASRSEISAQLQSWQAADWVWHDDLARINANEMAVISETAGMALGRRCDLIPINAMNAASLTTVGDGSTAFTLIDALTGIQLLQSAEVPFDNQWYCGLPSKAWAQFTSYKQVNNADWRGHNAQLPYNTNTQHVLWNGVNWFRWPDSYSPVPTANQYDFFLWHRSSVGMFDGYEVKMNVTWENLYSGWYMNSRISQASAVLLPEGIIRFRFASNSAITLN
ncbi:MAG TPA: phage capsid protein [Beijerinckiaceae bacterium]|jgi:hypothetical protein|nr:phage capsid protein [Beijerinckiaceae bacterium]